MGGIGCRGVFLKSGMGRNETFVGSGLRIDSAVLIEGVVGSG